MKARNEIQPTSNTMDSANSGALFLRGVILRTGAGAADCDERGAAGGVLRTDMTRGGDPSLRVYFGDSLTVASTRPPAA